jgi:dTDP-4-amino-4,6-dideoxygalactose transaminase
MGNNIPFLDLVTLHQEMEDELVAVFKEALRTASFIGGPMVEGFEKEFADFCDTRYCAGVGSGTDALRFALIASGVKAGDVVITVPNTFIATTEAITQAGALPEFVDIDERTYNMDPSKLGEYLETRCIVNDKTGGLVSKRFGKPVTAIIPVHLYGQVADMDSIIELAEKYNLLVIEDACQAHGAEYYSKKDSRWKRAGSIGDAAAFSFYPGKNLGACGEGGAVTTDDERVVKNVRMLRDHGQGKKYIHEIEGYNGRLDAIQAGILRKKLKCLNEWNEHRRRNAHGYNGLLNGLNGIVTPYEPEWTKPVYHLYVIRTNSRDELQVYLNERGIGTGLHYPVPLNLQKAYGFLGYQRGSFQICENIARDILSLPMYPGLTKEEQQRVAEIIAEFVSVSVRDCA